MTETGEKTALPQSTAYDRAKISGDCLQDHWSSGCISENKDAEQLISAFVFATRIVQSLYFLNTKFKPLAIFCGCAARFVWDLVGNPEDWFSHNEAHILAEMMEDGMDYEESCNGDPGDHPEVDLIHQDNETKENWLVYFAGKTEGSLDEWLERHTPSRINKHRHNVDWICVSRQREVREDLDLKVAAMLDAWDQLNSASGRPRNEKTVVELAKNFGVTSGKWLFFVDSGGKADHLWNLVARGITSAQLTCESAKISVMGEEDDQHVICMYNPDFTDMDQVMEAESSIRKLGIKCRMQYKPDAYTYLGIYGGNPWGMYPYILKSNFDISKGVSVITDHFSY